MPFGGVPRLRQACSPEVFCWIPPSIVGLTLLPASVSSRHSLLRHSLSLRPALASRHPLPSHYRVPSLPAGHWTAECTR